MQIYTIEALEANQRLDKFLQKLLKIGGKGYVYKMLRKRTINLNGKKATGKEILEVGDEIRLYMTDETLEKMMGKLPEDAPEMAEYKNAYEVLKKKIQIVYEDTHIILINKPVGILAQKAEKRDISCNEWLIGYLLHIQALTPQQLHTFKPSICNRLDRNTSGLMICGKTLLGSQKMNEMLKDRSLKKYYRTFVDGVIEEKIHLDGYLKKDFERVGNKVMISKTEVEGSNRVETIFEPVESGNGITYLEAELITGKPHQIRAHLSSIGHPILGDYKYGRKNTNELFKLKYQLLHAYRLEFPDMEGEFEDLSNAEFFAEEPPTYERMKRFMRRKR